MSEPYEQPREFDASTPDFQGEIDAITSRALTPENINTYADDALNSLVGVVQEISAAYDQQPTVSSRSGAEQESAAFSYFGLEGNHIEATLDHIANKADEIHELDKIIHQLSIPTDTVITPPNGRETVLTAGDGSYGEKQHIDRLKTLLFVVANTFEVDIKSPDECSILTGKVTEDMMRNEPYHLVTLPSLNREVLVCDEEGNVTYILDSKKLQLTGISRDVLVDMDKDSMNELISQYPGIGYRLAYSKLFTEELSSLLEHIPEQSETVAIDTNSGMFLTKKDIPGGFRSMNVIAKEMNISPQLVRKAIEGVGDLLGEVANAKFNSSIRPAYSPEQQELIKEWLNERGYFMPKAPEGYASINKIAESFSVSHGTIDRIIGELGDTLGNVITAKFGSVRTRVYSPGQQAMIHTCLEERNLIGVPAGEGYLSIGGLQKELGVSRTTLGVFIAKNVEQIGESTLVRVGAKQ